MKNALNPDGLLNNITDKNLPPVEDWNPPYCGEMDICIHRDGSWSYHGSPFTRLSLVKLFAKILKREGDDYFLVTPVEKVKIQVDAEPFITVAIEKPSSQPATLVFQTNVGDLIIANKDHPISVTEDSKGQPYPTLHVRNNLHALISRSDFYQLVEMASTEQVNSTAKTGNNVCSIESGGCTFILGRY